MVVWLCLNPVLPLGLPLSLSFFFLFVLLVLSLSPSSSSVCSFRGGIFRVSTVCPDEA